MKIIAFGHRRRTGKNWVTGELMLRYPGIVWPHSFADKMKDVCNDLYEWSGLGDAHYYEENPHLKEIVLPAIGKSPRQIWIDFGTKAVRDQVYGDTWCRYLMWRILHHHAPNDIHVITDLRFPNEFELVKAAGGICIRLDRPDLAPADDPVDNALAGETRWDAIVSANTGELDKLRAGVLAAVEEYIHA